MPTLSREELKSVIAEGQGPTVSIFLPTHRAGPDIQQDPIRLKNLLKQAESQLITEGSRSVNARELLAPVSALLDDAAFWRHQEEGLAIFRSQKVFRLYHLPLSLQEFVSVSDRFYVKPLLPLLINDARYYVLALSQKAVRLLDCSRDRVQNVELPDVPQGMQEAVPGPAPELQHYSRPVGGNSSARFQGHGAGIDDGDVVNLTRYFHRIRDGLKGILNHDRSPLVLACVEYLAPLFREAMRDRHILEPIVAGNPDGLTNEELHDKSWFIAEPHFQAARTMAAAQYHEGIAKGRAGNSLDAVLPAAYQGRIATLFVPLGVHRWGRFDFDSLALEEHEQEQPGDDDLIELAAMQTVLQGGVCYASKPEEIPGQELLAAVYRY
ncbi:MAG: hypothetical protein K0S45_1936 [Nitrospira sp.]|nr:hypothetical protein [Nitrospira sp.]